MVVFLRGAGLGGAVTIGRLQQGARALLAPPAPPPTARPVAVGVCPAGQRPLFLKPQLGGWGFRTSARGLCSARKKEGKSGDGDPPAARQEAERAGDGASELSEGILKKMTVLSSVLLSSLELSDTTLYEP